MKYRPHKFSRDQCSILQKITVQYSNVKCSTVKYSAVSYIAATISGTHKVTVQRTSHTARQCSRINQINLRRTIHCVLCKLQYSTVQQSITMCCVKLLCSAVQQCVRLCKCKAWYLLFSVQNSSLHTEIPGYKILVLCYNCAVVIWHGKDGSLKYTLEYSGHGPLYRGGLLSSANIFEKSPIKV